MKANRITYKIEGVMEGDHLQDLKENAEKLLDALESLREYGSAALSYRLTGEDSADVPEGL